MRKEFWYIYSLILPDEGQDVTTWEWELFTTAGFRYFLDAEMFVTSMGQERWQTYEDKFHNNYSVFHYKQFDYGTDPAVKMTFKEIYP